MELKQIKEELSENAEFTENPLCRAYIPATINFYKKVGFKPPWIGYFASEHENIVGVAGFKGAPIDGKVEIAYGTFELYQQQGVGTRICKALIDIPLKTDSSITITARTLPQHNFSTKILAKNGFESIGTVTDPDDGEVWEWEYKKE